MADALFEGYRTKLVGLPVNHVWRGYGTALFLELGDLTSRTKRDGAAGNSQGQYSIMIQWAWRIEDEASILCGNDNDEDEWSVGFARLIGRELEDIALVGRLPELSIALSGGLYVASFNTLDGDLGWHIADHAADRCIGVKEGRVAEESYSNKTSNTEGAPL